MTAQSFSEALYRAKRDALLDQMTDSVKELTQMSEERRQAKLRLHDMNGGPALSSAPALPPTPVVHRGRTAVIARGDKADSGHLANSDDLAERAEAWIERETKRTGRKPSWKVALVAVSGGSRVGLDPKESSRQLDMIQARQGPDAVNAAESRTPFMSAWTWSSSAGWQRIDDDPAAAARAAALASATLPRATSAPVQVYSEGTEPVAAIARALMRAKHVDYKTALLEASTL